MALTALLLYIRPKIRAYLQEVFLHDLVESRAGLHHYLGDGAGPDPVLEPEGLEGFTCRGDMDELVHDLRLRWSAETPTCRQEPQGQRQTLSGGDGQSHLGVLFPDQVLHFPQQKVELVGAHPEQLPEAGLLVHLAERQSDEEGQGADVEQSAVSSPPALSAAPTDPAVRGR